MIADKIASGQSLGQPAPESKSIAPGAQVDSVGMEEDIAITLYDVLAASVPFAAGLGETVRTLSKETLDADDETLAEAVLTFA